MNKDAWYQYFTECEAVTDRNAELVEEKFIECGFFRGGNWNNTSNAGVFYLNGNNPRSNSNDNIGFRPA